MQNTSATWKALVARFVSPGSYVPSGQTLEAYSENNKIYETSAGQNLKLYSDGDMVFDSDAPQTVSAYSGDSQIYTSREAPAADGDVWLESKAIIAGVEYTDISAPTINRALMQTGLSIGNATSAACQFYIREPGVIPKSAEVQIVMRLNDGETQSEWLPAGTYYISKRQRDPVTGLLSLECYDAMLKANAEYAVSGAWPKPMAAVVDEIAAALGVTVDPRTVINTGADYTVPLPDAEATMNAVLSGIATVHCGNWCITPDNQLRLVPVISASGAADAATDVIDVEGIVGSIVIDAAKTITGLRVTTQDGEVLLGNDTGIIVSVNSTYLTEDTAGALLTMLRGQQYQHFSLSGAVYDPAAELGDYVRGGADGDVRSVLYSESATLGVAFRGSISAPEPPEIDDEYPYISKTEALEGQIRRLTTVIADKAEITELQAVTARLDNLNVDDIQTGLIHSPNYQTEVIPKIYPSDHLYPSDDLYPNFGERVTQGFAIDFSTGLIYGNFENT